MLAELPAVNACLNGAAAVLLSAGWVCVRRGRKDLHRLCMLSAFACSTLFLVSYLYYHAHAGIVRFQGTGSERSIYLSILATHTVLAVLIVPLALRTLYLAARGHFASHRRWARWTLPLWLYVSTTGVIIYKMLYRR